MPNVSRMRVEFVYTTMYDLAAIRGTQLGFRTRTNWPRRSPEIFAWLPPNRFDVR